MYLPNNLLLQGNNLLMLQQLLTKYHLAGKVDLIYIDPPFATGKIFNTTHANATATVSQSNQAPLAYADNLQGQAYFAFIEARLHILKELLAPTGSIYVHTDYKLGHYLKVMLDAVFGADQFRNEISRIKCNPKNFKRLGYGNIKDMLLFYTRSNKAVWNEPYQAFSSQDIERLYPRTDAQGRRYTTVPLHAPGESTPQSPTGGLFKGIAPPPGRHWRTSIAKLNQWDSDGLIAWSKNGNPRKIVYADEQQQKGKRIQDIWHFKDPAHPKYPTEKNANMLARIIQTSSNKNQLVLDAFCGSGTTLLAAHQLHRQWIGIDVSPAAITATQAKLAQHNIHPQKNYIFIPPK